MTRRDGSDERAQANDRFLLEMGQHTTPKRGATRVSRHTSSLAPTKDVSTDPGVHAALSKHYAAVTHDAARVLHDSDLSAGLL